MRLPWGAYRKLALQHHPDCNPGDKAAEQRLKEINKDEVLKDEQKRAPYDQFGHAAFEGGKGGGRPGNFDFGSFADVFDDLFGDFMGAGGRRRGSPTTVRCEACNARGGTVGGLTCDRTQRACCSTRN